MNIQLNPKKTKKESKGRKPVRNVFAGDNDSDDSADKSNDDQPKSAPSTTSLSQIQRDAVNRSILQEQETLYQQQAKTAVEYDFDGTYDDRRPKEEAKIADKEENKKSRYIGDLLKAAERRKRTHDLVYDRNIAREQAQEEELDPELRGKDRFITASYKQKLQEQKHWKAKEEEEDREEQLNDVTKRGTMAHFYGNFTRNVAAGGAKKERSPSPDHNRPSLFDGFTKDEGTENSPQPNKDGGEEARAKSPTGSRGLDDSTPIASNNQETDEQRRLRQRKDREARVASALERYLLRHPSLATT